VTAARSFINANPRTWCNTASGRYAHNKYPAHATKVEIQPTNPYTSITLAVPGSSSSPTSDPLVARGRSSAVPYIK
jgi:hypothetical protein